MNFNAMSAFGCVLTLACVQCGGGVSNADSARRAYVGFDKGVSRAISLGFDGLTAASSANIPEQTAAGDVMGTMLVAGQVSQGSSTNREMRLTVQVTDYQDMVVDMPDDAGAGTTLRHRYSTVMGQTPLPLTISLRPPMFTGTLTGTVRMAGELAGDVTFNLVLAGQVESPMGMPTRFQRVPNGTRITGTVTSPYGTYTVDVTR
ncbi:MAG: hypothetical protein Q8Q09_20360 [Deltaproteobacteria bacterium]|nr:hypothetical protein [Deltaproteobacteria bacterium]